MAKYIYLGLIVVITLVSISHSQQYYISSYGQPNSDMFADIYLKVIDLPSHSVIQSLKINNKGIIWDGKPVSTTLNNHSYILSFSEYGGAFKNSLITNLMEVYYSIFIVDSGRATLVRSDSLSDASIGILRQYQNEDGFRLEITRSVGSEIVVPYGTYGINNDINFAQIHQLVSTDRPGLVRAVGSFENMAKVPFDSLFNLYYTIQNSQWWLIKLNANRNSVIDSVQLRESKGQNTIFGFNPNRNKFYCFHTNYEGHVGAGDSVFKSREDYYINPDVRIYDPRTLEIIEQHPIADYPEGEYINVENGLIDVVGDYLVHYFFEEDGDLRYDPAMLFIFDTRTNEATWLRVGWR
jgi:hypothetical protein